MLALGGLAAAATTGALALATLGGAETDATPVEAASPPAAATTGLGVAATAGITRAAAFARTG
jgi:hypothetical protein